MTPEDRAREALEKGWLGFEPGLEDLVPWVAKAIQQAVEEREDDWRTGMARAALNYAPPGTKWHELGLAKFVGDVAFHWRGNGIRNAAAIAKRRCATKDKVCGCEACMIAAEILASELVVFG